MSEIKITYESLFDLLRRERNREDLQKLEETFYQDVVTYLAEKKSLLQTVDHDAYNLSADAEKTRIQFHNIKRILKELYDRREKKIVMLALNAVRTNATHIDKSAFLPQEQTLYGDITRDCSLHRRTILDNVLYQTTATNIPSTPQQPKQEETPQPKPTKTEETPKQPSGNEQTITFTKAVPRFSGGQDKVFGPYQAGETATLPNTIATVLVKKGRATPN